MQLKTDEAAALPAAEESDAFRSSFEAFYRREIRSIVGLAYVLSGSSRAAEDLAQEAFLSAFRHWDRIGAFDNPGAWVRRVVSTRAVSLYRRKAAEDRRESTHASQRISAHLALTRPAAYVGIVFQQTG
jgi:DNA-directed RNA polymerase specialized sigma24 family protein